jgi:hypothetical protein
VCPFSPASFNIYSNEFIQRWLNMIQTYFNIAGDLILPLTCDYTITTKFEVKLQEATHKLSKMRANTRIAESPPHEKQQMLFSGAEPGKAKIVVNRKITKNAPLNILSCKIS